jgi:hypothetical protein
LWDELEPAGRIPAAFPEDWKYYTLTFPVAGYRNFSGAQLADEMETCDSRFYALPRIAQRVWRSFWQRRNPLISLLGSLSYRRNLAFGRRACREFLSCRRRAQRIVRAFSPEQLRPVSVARS